MNTADAIKAIRKALRRKGTTAEVSTRLGGFPTTKEAVRFMLSAGVGELVFTSGDYWTFQQEGEDFETSISASLDTITVYAGS